MAMACGTFLGAHPSREDIQSQENVVGLSCKVMLVAQLCSRKGTPMNLTRSEVLNQKGVADLLGVSLVQVWRLRREHGLPAFRFGSSVRFRRSEVLRWLEEHREVPPVSRETRRR